MKKPEFRIVGVLCGGPSSEREVSLRSGEAVSNGLIRAGYEVRTIDVTTNSLNIPEDIEAVFVALHGAFGEDGCVQRLLEDMQLPYTGAGPEASRISFDKLLSKQLFTKAGLPTPEYGIVKQGDANPLPLPVVIKPVREGSSIGIHIVFESQSWGAAIANTLEYGDEALVERFIEGRELTVGVVANRVLPVVEIAPAEGHYDYSAKYLSKDTRYIVPAEIPDEISKACQDLALQVFHVLGCSGVSRVDFRMTCDGQLYILENNSIPGFTETSLLPKAAKAAGIEFHELCDEIMQTASVGK